METTHADSWSDMAQPCDMNLWVMKWRSAWPIFHGPYILILPEPKRRFIAHSLPCSPFHRLEMTEILLKGRKTLTHPSILISWRLFDVCTSYFGSMNQYDLTLDLNINVDHCGLYSMVQWLCLISWRLFDVWTSYFVIIGQYNPMFDLKINVGLCDLYFMVQWLCLISSRLVDAWVS